VRLPSSSPLRYTSSDFGCNACITDWSSQLGQRRAIGGDPRLIGQRLQQAPRVVLPAEERAIEALGRRLPRLLPDDGENAAEERSGDETGRELIAREVRDRVERLREAERHGHADENGQCHQTAAHEQIARAAAKQHGNLHRAVLHNGVAE
jgi:hypothetical protein